MATPTLISWNLTRRCNLACGHCYLDAVQRKSACGDELSTDEALRVVAQIAELASGAMLVLTGGEPLLRRDLDQLVAAAALAGLMPVIGTNGLLLDPPRAQRLRLAGAVGVGISVDSAAPAFHDRLRGKAGAWAGAMAGMDAARGVGLGVLMQTTLFQDNLGELSDMALLARDSGAMALNFFFLVCTGRGVTQTDLSGAVYEAALRDILALQEASPDLMVRARCAPYARRMLGLHAGRSAGSYAEWSSACLAGRSYLRIGPQGDVTPCPYIPDAVGNLRVTPLRKVWETGPDFVRLRTALPGGKCGTCDFRISCGGCRARALATTGNLMAGDDKCQYLPHACAGPEPVPMRPDSGITWEPAAQALLGRIPGFVRAKVQSGLEGKAAALGEPSISVDFMRAHRPINLAVGRPPGMTELNP